MGEEISNQPAVDKVTKYYSLEAKTLPVKHLAIFYAHFSRGKVFCYFKDYFILK